jgi:hypothetical protein
MHKLFSSVSILIVAVLFSLIVTGCSNYGTKLTYNKTNDLYYTGNVTKEEAQSLGDYLVEQEFFANDENARSVQLDKSGSTYQFRMVVKKGLEQDQSTINTAKIFAAELSKSVFNGKTVDIHFCDDSLKTLKVVVAE